MNPTLSRRAPVLAALALAVSGTAQDRRPQIGRVTPADIPLAATPAGVASDVVLVQRPGAAFLQLRVVDADLRGGGWIEVQAPHESRPEVLDAATLAAARGMTLLHGGDSVAVRLCPGAGGVATARIDLVAQGFAGGFASGGPSPQTLCGNDAREPSAQRQVARLLITELDGIYWGTAFLIDPLHTMATAGHNVSESDLVSVIAEFNVPASLADGTPQPAALADQYRWEGPAAMRYEHVPGADWGVLRLQRNAQTNLWPALAQGGFLRLAQAGPATGQMLRVIGCGRDDARAARNLTQQTADGAHAGTSGNELRHRVDTMPGNSGSPVLDPVQGTVFGVHVRGGCSAVAGTFNAATSNDHAPFATARLALAGGSADVRVDTLLVPASAAAGTPARVHATVSNAVEGSAPFVRYSFFLSQTGTLDASTRILGPSFLYQPFIVRATSSPEQIAHNLVIPADLPAGNWQLGMWIDSFREVIEANESNNVRWQPIAITPPAATARAIECQHTLGGASHKTDTWFNAALPNRGHGALPVASGGSVAFAVTAPEFAGHWSLCAWSALNFNPFLPDAYTELCLGALNSPIFAGWLAPLDAEGKTFPRFNLPANIAAPHPGIYVKAFFVRADFGALLGESDEFVTLTLR